MTTSEFLARARSQLKFGLKYRLGGGKTAPVGEHCGDEAMSCDCCLAAGAIVQTKTGPVPIEELSKGAEVWTWQNGIARLGTVSAAWENAAARLYRLRTCGRELYATANHRFLALQTSPRRRDGGGKFVAGEWSLVWKRLSGLHERDWIVVASSLPQASDLIPPYLDLDFARFLGLYLADGYCSGSRASMSVCVYGNTREWLSAYVKRKWGAKKTTAGATHGLRFSAIELFRILQSLELPRKHAHEKSIPRFLWSAPTDIVRSFLLGYAEGDGHTSFRRGFREISYHSTSKRMIGQLRDLWQRIGSRVSRVGVNKRLAPIEIKGKAVKNARPLFSFTVWPDSARRGDAQAGPAAEIVRSPFVLQRITALTATDRVEPVYDIEVDGVRNFLVDGIVAHNSAFVCWCARMRKYQGDEFWWLDEQNDGWLNTDGIYIDAVRHTSGNFEKLVSPKPGAVIVYPAARVEGSGSKSKWGHIGIVMSIQNKLSVIHCSSGNYRTTGRAVAETDAAVFERHNAIFCWPSSVRPW